MGQQGLSDSSARGTNGEVLQTPPRFSSLGRRAFRLLLREERREARPMELVTTSSAKPESRLCLPWRRPPLSPWRGPAYICAQDPIPPASSRALGQDFGLQTALTSLVTAAQSRLPSGMALCLSLSKDFGDLHGRQPLPSAPGSGTPGELNRAAPSGAIQSTEERPSAAMGAARAMPGEGRPEASGEDRRGLREGERHWVPSEKNGAPTARARSECEAARAGGLRVPRALLQGDDVTPRTRSCCVGNRARTRAGAGRPVRRLLRKPRWEMTVRWADSEDMYMCA